jgi:hypothetical protein
VTVRTPLLKFASVGGAAGAASVLMGNFVAASITTNTPLKLLEKKHMPGAADFIDLNQANQRPQIKMAA